MMWADISPEAQSGGKGKGAGVGRSNFRSNGYDELKRWCNAEVCVRDDEELSHLIGEIYDAALDPAKWPIALAKSALFVGGQAAGLLSKNPVSQLGSAHYHVGVDADSSSSTRKNIGSSIRWCRCSSLTWGR